MRIPHNKGKKGWTNSGSFIKSHPDFVSTSSRKIQGKKLKGHQYWGPKKWTKKRKAKMSRWMSLYNPFKGKKHTEKTKKKVGEANKNRIISLKTRKKLSKANGGKNSYLWRGGITPINLRIRHSLRYKLWRNKVFARDNWTCQKCGERSKKGKKVILNADHIKSFSLYPKLRFKVSNGRTLCLKCHKKTITYLNKYADKKI